MGFDGTNDRPAAWQVSDAPENYITQMKKAITGIEIKIDRMEGKFKMSQELADGDREGTISGLKKLQTPGADEVARLVEDRGIAKNKKAS